MIAWLVCTGIVLSVSVGYLIGSRVWRRKHAELDRGARVAIDHAFRYIDCGVCRRRIPPGEVVRVVKDESLWVNAHAVRCNECEGNQ